MDTIDKLSDASIIAHKLRGVCPAFSEYRTFMRLAQPVMAHHGRYEVFGVSRYDDMHNGHVGLCFWISTPNGKKVWPDTQEEWDANPLWYDEPWQDDAWPGSMDMFTKGIDVESEDMLLNTWPLVLDSLEKHGFQLDTAPKYMG